MKTLDDDEPAPVDPETATGDSTPADPASDPDVFELSAAAIDIDQVLSELEAPAEAPPATIRAAPIDAQDLDGVFAQLRGEASRRSDADAAEAEYQRGLALRDAGEVERCIQALTSASRAPQLRFVAAAAIGRLYKEQGLMPEAIEWLERAAQAPSPTPADYHDLLLDLADGLESTGEVARALAVCLELEAQAGSYRDVKARVKRLSNA
jgi:tetratricopeptide (TPR) repeat protein